MSIVYKLNVNKLPLTGVLVDIYYNHIETISNLGKTIPVNRYDFVSFREESIYLDVDKMMKKLQASITLWDSLNINKIYIHIPNVLLTKDMDELEFILSSIVRTIFTNIYKTSTEIIITHDGNENDKLKNIISMIQKVQVARLLSMLPANLATPEKIAKRIQTLYKNVSKTSTRILNKSYLEKHKFGLLLAVNKGSKNKPCVLVIERKINPKNPTICIVGKGITFDSGGLAIKTLRSMKDMKYDKIGAVNGAISLLHLLEMKDLQHINFIGIFPFAENVISENAILPGDVITSLSGKTVEIINPDAEGRLILADAFTYANRYEPDLLIDIATLTGHAESINCWHNGYFFAEPENLKQLFEKRTNEIGERMIPMPTWGEYREVLNSTVADLINDSNVCDDSFTAALFLKEFLPNNCKWLHIDLAHEITGRIANGTGIRSIVDIVDKYIPKKK